MEKTNTTGGNLKQQNAPENKTAKPTKPAKTPKPPKPASTYQVNFRPGLEYVYRDSFNVQASQNDILLEFGNQNRADQQQIQVANRIVISIPCAVNLQKALKNALQESKAEWLKNLEQ